MSFKSLCQLDATTHGIVGAEWYDNVPFFLLYHFFPFRGANISELSNN